MSTLTGAVTAVYVRDQQLMVNVATGGPDGTAGVVVGLTDYVPQNGDNVGLMEFGAGLWAVVACFTPNRSRSAGIRVPNVTVANGAPGGWTQIATTYVDPGRNDNPDMYVIPSFVTIPPPPAGGTLSVVAGGSRSFRHDFGGSWAGDSMRLYQGSYGGYGPWDGCWFYPSMTGVLAGKTITACRIRLHRAPPAGSGGPVQTHLYLHTNAAIPGPTTPPTFTSLPYGPPDAALSWDGSADVPLPLPWAQALQSGAALGVGISGDDQATYSTLYGVDEDPASGQLFFDYS